MQADPIGLAGGHNLFVYSLANPATHFDPLGLKNCGIAPGKRGLSPCDECGAWRDWRRCQWIGANQVFQVLEVISVVGAVAAAIYTRQGGIAVGGILVVAGLDRVRSGPLDKLDAATNRGQIQGMP